MLRSTCVFLLLLINQTLVFGQEVNDLLSKSVPPTDSSYYYFNSAKALLLTQEDQDSYNLKKLEYASLTADKDSVLYWEKRLLAQFDIDRNYKKRQKTLEHIAYYHENIGAYDASLSYYFKVLANARDKKDTLYTNNALSDISQVHRIFHDYDKALYYAKEILKNANNNVKTKVDAYTVIGAAFSEMNKPDSAVAYYEKAMTHVPPLDSTDVMATFVNMGYAYLLTGDFKKSRKYNNISLNLYKKTKSDYAIGAIYINSGMTENAARNYKEALRLLDSGAVYSRRSKNAEMFKWIYDEEYKIYNALEDHKKAALSLKNLITVKDSLFAKQRAEAAAELETKYQTEKKENEILQQRAQLAEKELSIRKKNNLIYGAIGLAAVLGLLGYVVYSQQRLKNRQLRKEGELQTALAKIETQNRLQEQRLRISRDLHDNIGSQLTFIISSLDNLKYRLKNVAPEINEKLTEIGAFTRTTINELRDTIWAMNKEHIYFEDLQTRISNFIDTARSLSEKITFTFKVDRNDAKAYSFTAIEGIHVYRIIQEAVNN